MQNENEGQKPLTQNVAEITPTADTQQTENAPQTNKRPRRRRYYRKKRPQNNSTEAASNNTALETPAKTTVQTSVKKHKGHTRKHLAHTNYNPHNGEYNHKRAIRGGKMQSKRNPTLAEKLVSTLTGLIGKSLKLIIPWILFSTALFTVGAYYLFIYATVDKGYPLWYLVFLGIFVFAVYIGLGFFYGLAMSLLYTIKVFSESLGSLIRETINRIKNSIESKIDNITDTISRQEVVSIIHETFKELTQNIRKYAAKTAAGAIAIAALVFVIYGL
ncbi:MAG: hypothetical protein LBM71_00545, partial [Elusimicrobiota bacterium]|nr:hypothetical protein [Elusimicrobiota bacterium]